jgi:hypothetical protein
MLNKAPSTKQIKIPLQHEGVARSDGAAHRAANSYPDRWAPLHAEGELKHWQSSS